MQEKIRIQKLLSQKGLFSRRECEKLIRQKRLGVNDHLVELGDRVDENDVIFLDGKPLEIPHTVQQKVIAFHKPTGVECTLQASSENKTLLDFNFGSRVFPIGRLDKDSHGLLLLTNDGDLANFLAHPRYQKEKEYLVVLDKVPDKHFFSAMEKGVEIGNESKKVRTKPCQTEWVKEKIFIIKLTEGKNRQIRKMCEALDYKVKELFRTRIGKCQLGDLKLGKFRILSDIEINSLKK